MDRIEACMLSVGDVFELSDGVTQYVFVGWNHNVMMPVCREVGTDNIYHLHPNRAVYVNNFYKPLKS